MLGHKTNQELGTLVLGSYWDLRSDLTNGIKGFNGGKIGH